MLRSLLAASVLLLAACDGPSAPPPPTTGNLVILASGLPNGLVPSFTITDAAGATRTAAPNDTVRNLPPGQTVITPNQPSVAGIGRWAPAREKYELPIVIGATAVELVQFGAAPIIVNTRATGLPTSAENITLSVIAPDGTVSITTLGVPFVTAQPGTWTFEGRQVSATDFLWTAVDGAVKRELLPGDTANITVPYRVASGAIEVVAPGVDSGVPVTFTATQGQLTRSRVGPGVIPELVPGPWEIRTSGITARRTRYTPVASSQTATVTLGERGKATLAFTSVPVVTNFWVDAVYLTQSVQLRDGSLPLVAERDALLRVILRANEPNTWRPSVRATLYRDSAVLATYNIAASAAGVDTADTEGSLTATWNVRVPAAQIVPGLRVLVQADPTRAIDEDDDASDNVWPRNGQPKALNVTRLAPWKIVLIPVTNSTNNLTGNVTEANKNSFLNAVQLLMPIAAVESRVREPYTANVAALQNNDGNGAWLAMIREVEALRAAESRPGEYYYGIVKVDYTSGIAGLGYVPGRTALGWDYLPSGDRVAAHEWGHNFSRPHSPCGGVSSSDPNYPHAGGVIGSWGWNPLTNQLVSPAATDLMGYCGNQWISAYNFGRALSHRANVPNAMVWPGDDASRGATEAQRSTHTAAPVTGPTNATHRLLVWGGMASGRAEIEPAFLLDGAPAPLDIPAGSDRLVRVEAVGNDGAVLASAVTAAARVDHATGEVRNFAAALPMTPALHARVATVRVRDIASGTTLATRGRRTVRGDAPPAAAPSAERVGSDRVRIAYDDSRFDAAIVQNAATGRILSIVRRPGATVSARGDVRIIPTNGIGGQR